MYLLKKVFELREKAHSDNEKPFLDHLEDLRIMVTRVVLTLVVSMIICFTFQEQLMEILRAPAEDVLLVKALETMPDAKKYPGIKVPSVEVWNEAKDIESMASGLHEAQRATFYEMLEKPDMAFHARSVALLRAAKFLPEAKREGFVKAIGEDETMTLQLLALLESDPAVAADSGANIRMMSALKPTETFMLSMKLAFFAGIVLAFPLLLLFILQFVLPGLHEAERKLLWPAMVIGFGLFLSGVLFAYYFVLPRALLFFYEWSADLGVSNDWRIGEYITFATQFTLLFGLSFELPVVVMVLVKLGLLTYESMSRTRTYAIVAIYVAAALITPTPDIMTLNLMALPMLILYEICIWLAWFDRKKERASEAREEEELKQRRLEWMLTNAGEDPTVEPVEDDHISPHHFAETVEEKGDEGWYNGFEHEADHGMPEDEEWIQPNDAVTGDPPEREDDDFPPADIPEEERKRTDEWNPDKQD